MKIKNRDELLSSGNVTAREIVLDIIEQTLQNLDSYTLIKSIINLTRNKLQIGEREWDLSKKRHVFVVGAGKACNAMAKALDETLGARIEKGLVIVKKRESGDRLSHIDLVEGGHPLPNKAGLHASNRILDMVKEATSDDLFIGLISGGSSALMSYPVPAIMPEEEIAVTDALLRCGADILEINSIRRHISKTNGGRLAQKIDKQGAEMVNLLISDLAQTERTTDPCTPATVFGTPVAPDNTTLEDARNVLHKYELRTKLPESVLEFLYQEKQDRETPKALSNRITQFVLQRPADACETAKKVAEELNFKAAILTPVLKGESRYAGTFLASIAKEAASSKNQLFSPPCILIAGGETTPQIQIEEDSGVGGPSQELSLGFTLEAIDLDHELAMASIDTDGTDGPTEIAGGIVDNYTEERAKRVGLDIYQSLRIHDSHKVFEQLGDGIFTGNTGTNVCNLHVIYVGSP